MNNKAILTGREVLETIQTFDTGSISNQGNKKITLETTNKTVKVTIHLNEIDVLQYVFNSTRRVDYATTAMKIWLNTITTYQIQNNTIILEPKEYWEIYKKVTYGKEHMLGTGYTLTLNDKPIRFLTPQDYFNDKKAGVYGITYCDYLLYIGSASSYIERWQEHQDYFKRSLIQINPMYHLFGSIDKIKYQLLYDEEDFKTIYERIENKDKPKYDYCRGLIYETIEKVLIAGYKPKYNKEGKGATPFRYRVSGASWYTNRLLLKDIEEEVIKYIDKPIMFPGCKMIQYETGRNLYPIRIFSKDYQDTDKDIEELQEAAQVPVDLKILELDDCIFSLEETE